jgi:hypothetical protein
MTTPAPHLSRAAHVAEIHGRAINASRRRCGLEPVDAATLAREFADVERVPVRTKGVVPGTRSSQAADAMWGGIVARLNATLLSNSPPIGSSGERSSAAGGGRPTQTAVN